MAIRKVPGAPTIKLAYPFEQMSRKLVRRKKTCSIKNPVGPITYGGVMYTTRANKYGMGGRQYFFMRENARTTAPTVNELYARQRFAAVKTMVKERSEDLSKVDADQAAFIEQKDKAGGVKSMNAWYWMVCGEEYDKQHPRP